MLDIISIKSTFECSSLDGTIRRWQDFLQLQLAILPNKLSELAARHLEVHMRYFIMLLVSYILDLHTQDK